MSSLFLLCACTEPEVDESVTKNIGSKVAMPQVETQQSLPPVKTDTANIGGLPLELLNNNGACQIKENEQVRYLKPMAPCYFVRRTGELQTLKKANTTIIAVVGTLVKPKCGQEAQGLRITNGTVELSDKLGQGDTFCADEGLDNYYFSLF